MALINKQRRSGFSLVELLIAMALGLIVMAGMIAVFSGNKRSAELNTAMANIQENARFALDNIARDIRMSGYQGCLTVNQATINVKALNPPTTNLLDTAVSGSLVVTNSTWTPLPPTGFTIPAVNLPINGTHTLGLQFGSADSGALVSQMALGVIPSAQGTVEIDTDLSVSAGDLVLIANCTAADLFRVSAVAVNAGNGNSSISHAATQNNDGNLTHGLW